MNIEVTLLCSIASAYIGYASYRKKNEKDVENDAAQRTLLATKLDYISKGVDDIRVDIKSQDRSIKDLTVRMVRCEESTKSAHHRLDELKKGDVLNEK